MLFSLCVHGAALLYNLLVAERYEQAGLTEVQDPVAAYREEIRALRTRGLEVAAIRTRLEERHQRPLSYSAIYPPYLTCVRRSWGLK